METFVEKARNTRDLLFREAAAWRAYLKVRADELGTQVRRFPYTVEERLLGRAESVVERVDERLGERLRTLREGAPFAEYDALSAKDIVARLEAMAADQVRAVYEFERAHKARATVLRAAQQHLAA